MTPATVWLLLRPSGELVAALIGDDAEARAAASPYLAVPVPLLGDTADDSGPGLPS